MSDSLNEGLVDGFEASEHLTTAVMNWLARSYESMREWQRIGKEIFFSLNGQSDVARNRLASVIRKHFVETTLAPEEVRRWREGSNEQVVMKVSPPKISASNSAFVDWGYVADYILLACAAVSADLEEENQRRVDEFRQVVESYEIRVAVFEARMIIRQNRDLTDDEVVKRLKEGNRKAALAHVKEARRAERNGVRFTPPKPPAASSPMPRYTPYYF